mgnify:CR=1 FL=1
MRPQPTNKWNIQMNATRLIQKLLLAAMTACLSCTVLHSAENAGKPGPESGIATATGSSSGTLASSNAERSNTKAKPLEYRGFIGGMMIHTGYVSSRDFTVTSLSGQAHEFNASGAPFGIGGAAKFMFGKHLRIGAEGYVSTLGYGENGSHTKTGWGGLLADCARDLGKFRLFAGGTIGGGSHTDITIVSPIADDYIAEEFISYRKYGFAALVPFIGAEYALTHKVSLVAKVDWMLNLSGRQDDFVTGPRLYLGFMFGHADQ